MSKKAAMELNKVVAIVLTLFVLILIIMWVQGSFRAVSNPTSQIGKNLTDTSPSVINMINAWNVS